MSVASEASSPRQYRLIDLAKVWMLDLRVLGRSDRTLDWYRQKLESYFAKGGAESLEDFTAYEVKRYVVELQDHGLAPNTVHGCFQVLRGFANRSSAQDYPIDPALLRLPAPKVPQVEMETYSPMQFDAIIQAASPSGDTHGLTLNFDRPVLQSGQRADPHRPVGDNPSLRGIELRFAACPVRGSLQHRRAVLGRRLHRLRQLRVAGLNKGTVDDVDAKGDEEKTRGPSRRSPASDRPGPLASLRSAPGGLNHRARSPAQREPIAEELGNDRIRAEADVAVGGYAHR